MTEIQFADTSKIKMRMFFYMAQKELSKELRDELKQRPKGTTVMDVVHQDLRDCTNYAIRKLYITLMKSAKYMDEPHQTRIIADISAFGLWVVYKDTAYFDPLFWSLNELKDDERFWESVKQYTKSPDKWYCPTWHRTKKNTAKEEADNKITRFHMSEDEKKYVPQLQQQEWKKIEEDMKKEMEKRKNAIDGQSYSMRPPPGR